MMRVFMKGDTLFIGFDDERGEIVILIKDVEELKFIGMAVETLHELRRIKKAVEDGVDS